MPASTPASIEHEVAFDANSLDRLMGRLNHPLDRGISRRRAALRRVVRETDHR